MTIEIYDTVTLLQVVEGLPKFEPLFLDQYFGASVAFDTDTIQFDKLDIDQETKLAPFVSPKVAGQVRQEQGGEVRSFKPAYLKPKHVVDPSRVLVRRPGESIGGNLSAAERRNAIVVSLLDQQRKQIMRRMEWMAAQAVRLGKVTVEGENYPTVVVDFRRDSGLTKTISTANKKWSAVVTGEGAVQTSHPIDDLEEWDAELESPSTDVIMNKTAWKYFRRHPETKEQLNLRRGDQSTIDIAPGNGAVVQYKGEYGSKRVWVYTGKYTGDDGVEREYLESGEIVLASAAVEGVRAYGAILDPAAGYQALEMFPKNWISDDPAAEFLMTQSAPLIIPRRPNATMCVKVTDAT